MAERKTREVAIEDEGAASSPALYKNPVDRYAQLPVATRQFLEELQGQDIEALEDLLRSFERAKTIGGFFKWLFFISVGAFMGAVAFGEALSKVLTWMANAAGGG